MILHTEAKPKFTLLNNFNNMFNEGMLWSMGIAFRKDKNTKLLADRCFYKMLWENQRRTTILIPH